jgi:hypothetical protein
MRSVSFVCDTPGCVNEGHPIVLDLEDDTTAVMCGPCGATVEVA